jgi:hypothetical protein
MPDPNGSITLLVGGVQVTFNRTPEGLFKVTAVLPATATGSCVISMSLVTPPDREPITTQTTGTDAGKQIAVVPVSGNFNTTCSGGGSDGAAGSFDQPVTGTVTVTNTTTTPGLPPTILVNNNTIIRCADQGQQIIDVGLPLPPRCDVATAPNGALVVQNQDFSKTTVNANSRVVFAPNQQAVVINGQIDHLSTGPSTMAYSTGTVSRAVGIGTDFSVRYTQTGTLGTTVVTVRSGIVDVTNRLGQVTRLTAGQSASFEDSVPRVLLIIPVNEAPVVTGRTNTFSWTSFAGAERYRIEITTNAAGFATANATAPEASSISLVLSPGTHYIEGSGIATFVFNVPSAAALAPFGIVPGSRLRYRVFANTAAGATVPGSTASDSNVIIVQ